MSSTQVGALHGFRSGLETKNAKFLTEQGVKVQYEEYSLQYTKPAKPSKYTPDFILPNGIIVETKGRFLTADRQKHVLIKEQHPNLDVRFVFSNPRTRISKTSATTYAKWCESKGFLYASEVIPTAWLTEEATAARVQAAIEALNWNPL